MQLSEVGWQSIPRLRSCDAECSVSELLIGLWHDEIATACGDHVHETVPISTAWLNSSAHMAVSYLCNVHYSIFIDLFK